MPSASSSHRTSPEMRRSRNDNAFCADGGDDDNGLTQVDALLPTVTKPTIGGGAIGKGGTDGGAPTLGCHHHGHFDAYYYVILGSL